jgi:hypothetical protein
MQIHPTITDEMRSVIFGRYVPRTVLIARISTALRAASNTRINGRLPSLRGAIYPTRTVAS